MFESLDPVAVRGIALAMVAGLCDRLVLVDRGRMLASGAVPALIAAHASADEPTLDGAYAALVGAR